MFRKYVIITLAVAMFLGTNGCTSKKADGDASAAASSSDMDGLEIADATEDNSDLSTKTSTDSAASADAGASTDSTAAANSGAADLGIDDLAPEEKLPQDQPAVADNSVAPSDLTETPPPASDMAAVDTGATPTPEPSPTETTPAPGDMAATMDPGGAPMDPGAAAGMGSSDAPVSKASLQKVKSAPFRVGKILANAVYVARQGDSVEGISQKVFGTTKRVKDICKVNSYNCSRKVKVGDKFYYNSPQRPTDDTAMKIFYEDAGLQPEVYTAKAGDNIRKVAKELLGHKNSWMELWVTNEVESKQGLDEGTQLKYWPKTEVAAPAMAQADPAAGGAQPPDQMAPPPAQEDMAAQTPPPPPDQALADNGVPPPPPPPANDLPPAPDANQAAAAGSVEPPPPPPPPPPPTQAAAPDAAATDGAAGILGTNDPMVLGIGCVLILAAVALFISIRKKRSRRQIDFNTSTQTQID